MIIKHPMIEAIVKGRFSALLVSFVLLFLVGPFLTSDQGLADQLFGVLIMLVLASCLRAISRTRGFFLFMVAFPLLNLMVGSLEMVTQREPEEFQALVLILRAAYFVVVFFSIMRYVLDDTPVTGDKICGAIAAYLVMGVAWTFVYTLFYQVDPTSFDVPEALLAKTTINSTWAFYFSFTTLTTLGYGDITPLKSGVQSYAVLQAAIGQIFLAVIIARLIALHITHERFEKKGD